MLSSKPYSATGASKTVLTAQLGRHGREAVPRRVQARQARKAPQGGGQLLYETEIYTYPPINIYSIFFKTGILYSK